MHAEPENRAKDQVKEQGGQIGHEYNLIKGFQYDNTQTLPG